MKKILIQICTEFHYMVALSLIDTFYSENCEIHFVIVKDPNFKFRLNNIQLDERFKYHEIEYAYYQQELFPDIVDFKKFIENNNFYHFISFLYHDPIFVYLTYYFKKKNTVSFLAPDGMGAYVKFTSKHYRSKILRTLECYRFYKRHGYKFPKLWMTSWDFGKNGYYDYIYAYSKTLPYLKNKKIIEVDYTLSEDKIESLKKSFSVDFNNYPSLSKVVLVIDDRNFLPKYESKLLETINNTLPDYTILFKKHPNQKGENLSYLPSSVFSIDEIFPVELLIANLKDSIIISTYSNSMLYHNPSCHYFWTYPIITQTGELKKPIERFNPKKYIKVVQNFNELISLFKKINE
ncbi:hypothetical protein MASR1M29_20010 [Cloacibacterium normanense]